MGLVRGGSARVWATTGWRVLAVAVAIGAAIVAAGMRAEAKPTVTLTLDPAASGPEVVDLADLSYADAEAALAGTVTVPLDVDGLPTITIDPATLHVDADTTTIAIRSTTTLLGSDVDLLLTAVWPDAAAGSRPDLALGVHLADVGLDVLNPAFDYEPAPRLADAWLVTAPDATTLDPAALPAGVADFYPEAIDAPAGGVFLLGDVDVASVPALQNALGFVGHDGTSELSVAGTLAGSAGILADDAVADDTSLGLDTLDLGVTVSTPDPAEPWLDARTSTFTFARAGGASSITLAEELTVTVDGTTNTFAGSLAVDPATFTDGGTVAADLAADGPVDLPFGLDAFTIADVGLSLEYTSGSNGGLAAALTGDVTAGATTLGVSAGFAVSGETVAADLAIDGPVSAADVVALAGQLGGTSGIDVSALDGFVFDRVAFAFAAGGGAATFASTADLTLDGTPLSLLLSFRLPESGSGGTPQLLVGLRADGSGDCACTLLSDLTGVETGGVDLQLGPVVLLAAQGFPDTVAPSDLTGPENDFLAPAFDGELPDELELGSSLQLSGSLLTDGLPAQVRDTFGFAPGDALGLRGTLGVGLGAFTGGGTAFTGLSIEAVLPQISPAGFPSQLTFESGWTLALSYAEGAIETSAAGDVSFDLDGAGGQDARTVSASIAFASGPDGTTLNLTGATGAWPQPFGATWLDIETLELDLTVGSGGVDGSLVGTALVEGETVAVTVQLAAGGDTEVLIKVAYGGSLGLSDAYHLVEASLAPAVPLPDGFDQLPTVDIADASITLQSGGGTTAVSITGNTSVTLLDDPVTGRVLLDLAGGRFLLALGADDGIGVTDIAPIPGADALRLSDAALLLTNQRVNLASAALSDEAFAYFAPAHDCAADATAADCDFTLRAPAGAGVHGTIPMPADLVDVAEELWVIAGSDIVVHGQIPLFGGGAPMSLRAEIGQMTPPDAPDWFHSGAVAIGISNEGVGVIGDLSLQLRRSGDPVTTPGDCIGQVLTADDDVDYCYDVLDFTFKAEGGPSGVSLTGALHTDGGTWNQPFEVSWLQVDDVVLQLGVSPVGTVDMGFRGAVVVGGTDMDASISLGITPAPPWVILHGIRLQSTNGLPLSDLLWLQEQITGVALPTGDIPDLSVRNVLVSYADRYDRDLCLRPGVFIAGDLYVDAAPPSGEPAEEDEHGCTVFSPEEEGGESGGAPVAGPEDAEPLPLPAQSQACADAADCFASVLLEASPKGLVGAGYLGDLSLDPVHFEGAQAQLQLTPTTQQFGLSGAAHIGPADANEPQFAEGMLDLRISTSGFALTGDVGLFGGKFAAWIDAHTTGIESLTSLDFGNLSDLSFSLRAVLRADFRDEVSAVLDPTIREFRQVVLTFDDISDALMSGDLSGALKDLRGQLQAAGVPVPAELNDAIAAAEAILDVVDVGTDTLLNGWTGTIPGIPGEFVPSSPTCVTTYEDGECWTTPPACLWGECLSGTPGFWIYPECNGGAGTVVGGRCWTTAPQGVSLPGICDVVPGLPNDCTPAELLDGVLAEPMAQAFGELAGVDVPAGYGLDAMLDELAAALDNPDTTLALECAEFAATIGEQEGYPGAEIGLASRMNLFGERIGFGLTWDFAAAEIGSPDNVTAALTGIADALLDVETRTCVGLPGDAPDDAAVTGVDLSVNQAAVAEGGSVTAAGSLVGGDGTEREVIVEWGDGTSSTVTTSGGAFSATHTYVDDGQGTHGAATFVVTATVSGEQVSATANVTVTNAAPTGGISLDATTIDEAGGVTVTGSFTDAGVADTHTVVIDWGDGATSPVIPSSDGGTITFEASHTYVDDAPTATPSDTVTITATVTDDDTGVGAATAALTVDDVAPYAVTITPADVVGGEAVVGLAVDEGDFVSYTGTFADPGTADTHTVVVDWGDGSTSTVVPPAGSRSFQVRHRFVDDDPTGTPSDTYTITATVTDDDTLSGSTSVEVTVADVAPTVTDLAVVDAEIDEHGTVELLGSFADPGLADTFTVTIDWGAGWPDGAGPGGRYETIALGAGVRQFGASRQYGDDGPFTITVEVRDDDTLAGSDSIDVAVGNVAPTAAIDHGGTIPIQGVDTFLRRTGEDLTLTGTSEDPGSDDLTFAWDFDDGSGAAHPYPFVMGLVDPDPSPQVGPRDVTDTVTHAWSRVCLYDVTLDVTDDDGGASPTDHVPVVVVGHESRRWGSGDWAHQFSGRGRVRLDATQRDCHLAVVRHLSAVFDETVSLADAADARAVLQARPRSEHDRLDLALLTAWLDVANGALDYHEVADDLAAAEVARLDPSADRRDLRGHRQALHRLGR